MSSSDRTRQQLVDEIEELRAEVATLSEAKRASSQAKTRSQREVQLESIWEAAFDALITIDERGTIEDVNPAFQTLFGYDREEVLGQNVKTLMPEPLRGEHDGYLHRYRETGERKIIGLGREVMGQRKDGSCFPAELAVAESQAGGRRSFTGFLRNIEQRKLAEERALQQERNLRELSTPCIRVWEGVVTAPIIGVLDSIRSQQLMETLLQTIVETRSKVAILDITGVSAVDTHTAGQLIKTAKAVQLLGCRAIVTGVRREIAQTLVSLGSMDLKSLETKASMADGFLAALDHLKLAVVPKENAKAGLGPGES